MQRVMPVVSVLALALFLSGRVAAFDEPGEKPKTKPKAEKLEPYQCGKVQRLHVLGQVFLASQPQQEDFKTAKENGIKTVVNLREKSELDWDEAALVKKLGMEYVHLPFKSPESLTDEVFDRARKLLKDKDKQPLILHCATANRVGAIWLAHRMLDGGLSFEDAAAEAKSVGLRLPAYTDQAKDYVERMRKNKQ